MDDVVRMVNSLELARGRLISLTKVIDADSAKVEQRKGVRAAIDSLDTKLERLEEKLFQRRTTGRGQDDVRWSPRLAEQLEYLAGSVGGSDYAPTASQREVARLLHERAAAARSEFNDVTARELAAINEQLRRAGLDAIGG
jgi:predicted HicB family RNase H-like nuclease